MGCFALGGGLFINSDGNLNDGVREVPAENLCVIVDLLLAYLLNYTHVRLMIVYKGLSW